MRTSYPLTVGLALLMSCGGGDGGLPFGVQVLDDGVKAALMALGPTVARMESSFVLIMNSGTPAAQGVTVLPDNRPGAPPNSFTVNGAFDGVGDGNNGTSIAGRVTFGTDPNIGWSTATGDATLDINNPTLGQVFHGNFAYSVTSTERRLSGSGTVAIPLTGITGMVTVDPAAPLVVKTATGAPGAVSNACGYSLAGSVQVEIKRPTGTLTSTWHFSSNSSSATVQGATFLNPMGQSSALPDSAVELRCGSGGAIGDWAGSYIQDWACLPRETGQAKLTIAVNGPDSVTISDEDPPGQFNIYNASVVGVSPRSLRGFFIAGPPGNEYREDFNWSQASNGAFSQISLYTFQKPPNASGICAGIARRVP